MSAPINNVTDTALTTDTRSLEAQAEMVAVRTGLPRWRLLARDPLALCSASLLAFLFVCILFGPEWLGKAATDINLRARNLPPGSTEQGWVMVLGSDALGRSILARLVVASRNTLTVAFGRSARFASGAASIASAASGVSGVGLAGVVDDELQAANRISAYRTRAYYCAATSIVRSRIRGLRRPTMPRSTNAITGESGCPSTNTFATISPPPPATPNGTL